MEIGKKIRTLRKERKMTLVELSEKSGVAQATLSRIENGRMTGTLESHMKICEALEITLPELYSDIEYAKKEVEVQPESLRTEVFVHDEKSSSEMLTKDILRKKMMPVMLKLDPGGITHREENQKGTEKFLYVLEGTVEATIGEKVYTLTKGATLYFESSIPHFLKNVGNSKALCLCIITPPAL